MLGYYFIFEVASFPLIRVTITERQTAIGLKSKTPLHVDPTFWYIFHEHNFIVKMK